MHKQAASLLGCIFALVAVIFASLLSNNTNTPLHIEHLNISSSSILQHVSKIIQCGDAETYESGRRDARDYIKHSLQSGGIPQDNIFWHYFEWKEQQQGNTLTWSGYNILVWLNKTSISSHKVRVFGAHYDTLYWGKNSTAGASTLAGTGLLIDTAISLFNYQIEQKKINSSFEEVPYLFVFFDHHEAGALGAKVLVDQLDTSDIAYFIGINSVGYLGSSPILHTLPYDHLHSSHYTPYWLTSLLLRAGISKNVQIKIGSKYKLRSLLYQAYRYHWQVVSFLGEEGPFAWAGIPSASLSDLDMVFEPSPHYKKPTDQIWNLEESKIKGFSKLLSAFIFASHSVSRFNKNVTNEDYVAIFTERFPNLSSFVLFFLNGVHQYLGVGIFVVKFVEIASLSFVIIAVVGGVKGGVHIEGSGNDLVRIKSLKELSLENESEIWQGHKILIVHMLLMSLAVIVDTVFAFQMLILGFLALSTIHFSRCYINIVTGFICSILCVNLLYRDVLVMSKFGERTRDFREIRLIILLLIYLFHSSMLLIYGFDYNRKRIKLTELITSTTK